MGLLTKLTNIASNCQSMDDVCVTRTVMLSYATETTYDADLSAEGPSEITYSARTLFISDISYTWPIMTKTNGLTV